MTFVVVLTVDRNASIQEARYPGPQLEFVETHFSDFFVAVTALRTSLFSLGVLEGHLEDGAGNLVDLTEAKF